MNQAKNAQPKPSKFHSFLKSASYLAPLALRKKFMDQAYGHFIFSKFEDAWFDELGWKYVVPEPVSKNFARHCRGLDILDAYAGIGGTSIQLALAGNRVASAEIDDKRFSCMEHNARLYGADARMELWHGDVQDMLRRRPRRFGLICVDPPWKIIKENFEPYLEFFFGYSGTLVFKVPKGTDNGLLAAAGAGEVREIYVNRTLFHKEAFFYKTPRGKTAIVREHIAVPAMKYLFP